MSIIKLPPYILDSTLDFTFNNVTATGNLVSLNANLGNLASANYVSGNGSLLTGLTGANVTGQVANALVAGTVLTAAQPNITSTGTLTSVTVSGDGSIGGNLTITGNLTVSGTQTTVNSTTVNINDINIVLANNASSAVEANSAGITINGAGANIVYLSTPNAFSFSHKISADGSLLSALTGANVTGTVANATYAVTAGVANSVAGANVTGVVGNATHATISDSANSVAVANVVGIGNISTINIDGNSGNILYGNGVFAAAPSGGGGGGTYGNSDVASYLPTYTGNLSAGNLSVSGNITDASGDLTISTTSGGNLTLAATAGGQLILDGLKWPTSDGTADYVLKTDGAGNLSWVAQSSGGSGTSFTYTAAATPPASGNNAGDQWFNTETNVLYEYINDGTTSYWVDIISPTMSSSVTTGYITRNYTANGTGSTFTVSSGCMVDNVLLFLNGVCQTPTTDYTISGTTLTTDVAPDSGTLVQIRELPR